jgi:hypothetical protein
MFNVTFGEYTFGKLNIFGVGAENLMKSNDEATVLVIESNHVDSIEKFLEIILHGVGVGTLRQNLKQVIGRAEIEAGENGTLGFKIVLKLLLAEFEAFLKGSEGALQDIVLAALDNILLFVSTLHNFEPLLVNGRELLGFSGHLL